MNQQKTPLNQHKIADVGSVKPSGGEGWRSVNQLNQLNQHIFIYIEALSQF
ncbi:hypothetical protein CSC35_2957 [Enterobacter hormaechei]|nr:hypothetical protein CSC35_2957 [Enterobacter hormaechei]